MAFNYICACKILQQNEFVENGWPANSALFMYVSAHCVETVELEIARLLDTRWYRGNASAFGARGPGFNSRFRLGSFMFDNMFWTLSFLFDLSTLTTIKIIIK